MGSSSGSAKAFIQFRILNAASNTAEYAIDDFKAYGGEYAGAALADISSVSDAAMLKQNNVYVKESIDADTLRAALTYEGELKIFADSDMKTELDGTEAIYEGNVRCV